MTVILARKPISLLIFDMDGVLVSTSACHAQAYRELWNRLELTGPDYPNIAGRKTSEVVQEATAVLNPDESDVRKWVRFKQNRARDLIESTDICFPDTLESLERLSAHDVKLALGTAASPETAFYILDRYQIRDHFSIVLTAKDVNRGKPAPDIYRAIVERQNIAPDMCLVVEDSYSGIEAAISAGLPVVSVRTRIESNNPAFLASYADLSELLSTLQMAL
ncbi:MAG TPA: HAD family phosphatase [Acidiferrobacteraceae bacterium]|nr:HAD family phosphatase [Acidiferrobacteraceae bacterium]